MNRCMGELVSGQMESVFSNTEPNYVVGGYEMFQEPWLWLN